jgi:hypothetical protein
VSAGHDPAPTVLAVALDERGRVSLDGTWEFYAGGHEQADLDRLAPEPITVPGLWEAQDRLELDGHAWYRRRLDVGPELLGRGSCWTLRFDAVMDVADVWFNGVHVGCHEHPFTPFDLPVAPRPGENVVDVRVFDPPLDHPLHIRSAHGKQGWANHVFPSRPSLYLTYGGIWQPVVLRRHGPLVVHDVFVNSDPDDLRVVVEVRGASAEAVAGRVTVRTLGFVRELDVVVPAGEVAVVDAELGPTVAPRWDPTAPVLHEAHVDVAVGGELSDRHTVRYGLRTVRVVGDTVEVNGVPYRMKSVLVQGFRAEELYAEGTRAECLEEVRAAQAMGFNTVRLHIKAFDPVYLDVCDEVGMLVEADLPVAEPIAHEELGDGTELSRRCTDAVVEQVRRDRNHPSIILWSCMNELGLDREGVRGWPEYEQFARTLYSATVAADPTRPAFENEWVEPDPDRVFSSPLLCAHWYGRLHADYLDKIEAACLEWKGTGRPLYVTEFGDWGLPEMPLLPDAPFWDPRDIYAAGLASTLWPSTIHRFVQETQRYQGISDRMQIEVFRRHGHIGGYCLTELTDVPHELNGLLDLHRRPKPYAVAEVARANQPVLPMLHLDSLVVRAGALLDAPLHVANDGPALADVTVQLRFGGAAAVPRERLGSLDTSGIDLDTLAERFSESVSGVRVGDLPAHQPTAAGRASIRVPTIPGNHDLLLVLRAGDVVLAENRYPIHVVAEPHAPYPVRLLGGGATAAALAGVGATVGSTGPTVVAEGELTADLTGEVRARLDAGETVVVLAQAPDAAAHYPVPVQLSAVETEWGSSVFHFTTDSAALPSFPRRNLLVAEESTVQARSVLTQVGDHGFPSEPVVIAYKPVPGSITGTVVGLHRVGTGRLILCQYRLAGRAAAGDAAACALLADLVRWAADPPVPTVAERTRMPDGRAITWYSWEDRS